MSFTPLVDAWHESEETRSRLRPGRRWYRMEKALGDGTYLADMTPNRHHWRFHETPDGVARVRELWRYYPTGDSSHDGDAEREHDDTELVDEFADEFTDTSGDDAPEHAPGVGARERVDRARDAVRSARAGATEHEADNPHASERREQVARWHADDHGTAGVDASDDAEGDVAEAGWSR